MRFIRLLALPTCTLALVACAQGATLDSSAGGAGGAGGGWGAGGSTSTSSSSSSSSGSTSSSSSSSSSSGSSGSTSSSSSSSSSGSACDFAAPTSCAGAESIADIAGDDGSDTRTETGHTSRFFTLQVLETVNSLFSYPGLSYTVTLTSPAGAQYGLFVYPGGTCGSPQQGTGTPATFHDSWSDTPGFDDSEWVTIEVRHLSGEACGPSDDWTLTIQGNTG